MKTVSRAWLFDVDGVLTNQNLKVNQEVVEKIAKLASENMPVTLLTGRSDSFILEYIVPVLKSNLSSNSLENLYAVAEFGAIHVSFKDGHEMVEVEKDLSLPLPIATKAQNIASEFSESMWIEPKRTMFTIVSNEGYPQEKFREQQSLLVLKLKEILEQENATQNFEVHQDSFATNIRSKQSNKRHATQVILDWIKNRGFEPDLYIAIGDSLSDIEIKGELDAQNLPNKLVFVGDGNALDTKDENIIFTNAKYDEGTLEFLSSQKYN